MVFPLIPIILIGTTLATVASTALLPQSINEPTKQELKKELKQELKIVSVPQDVQEDTTKFVFTEFINDHFGLVLIGLLLLLLAVFA